MTNKTFIVALLAIACGSGVAFADEPLTAKVLGQRVNLRAKADTNAEVVGQVSSGDTLIVKSVTDVWAEVRPPDSVDLWVSRDLVSDGKIIVSKANVRAGPGINYTVVGMLVRGDVVNAKGSFGEWVRIAPFDAASLWVSKDLLEINYPLRAADTPAPETVATTMPPASAGPSEPPPPEPMAASDNAATGKPSQSTLIPLEGQGQSVEMEGILKPVPYLFNRPSQYRLARRTGNGFETVCYLKGNTDQLQGLRDEHLRIKGRQYWVQGAKEPLLAVESIQKLRSF